MTHKSAVFKFVIWMTVAATLEIITWFNTAKQPRPAERCWEMPMLVSNSTLRNMLLLKSPALLIALRFDPTGFSFEPPARLHPRFR